MLNYLRWLSVVGVWLPIAGLAAWTGISWVVGVLAPEAGWGFVVIGIVITFGLCHVAISSLVGAGLLLTRRAPSPAFTLLSVIVGGLVSAFVLSGVYFDFNP